jgi:hypothetical protein
MAGGALGWVVPALLLIPLMLGTGCSDSDDDPDIPEEGIKATFNGSGTTEAPNLVYLRAGSADEDLITLEVVIVGPTTSQDLYSFVFDLVLSDPTVAAYRDGTAVVGNALGAGQGQSVQVVQTGNRLVCGVTKTGGGGNGVGNTQATVLSLGFRVLEVGSTTLTFAGAPPAGTAAALDSNGDIIGSVTFDTAPATITGK